MADGRRPARSERGDDGFTLIEVIVALGIFLVVMTALLPQFVAGIRSVSKADREGVTKGILQQQVDRLRGLPYRVSLGSSGGGTDADVDLLDIYYPNLVAPATPLTCTSGAGLALPTTTAGTGYVVGSGCTYEPTGPFYRTVKPASDAQLGTIALVYDVQFLSGGTAASPAPAAATPRAGYDSDHAVTNYPPSTQVGVTVTVLYRDRGAVVARSLSTQIADRGSGPELVKTKVDAQTVEITSLAPSGASESLTAGVLSLAGSVGDISTADVSLSGVVARVATGDTTTSQLGYGATSTVAAPPSVATFPSVDVTPDWGPAGCTALLCFGRSKVESIGGAGVVTDGGLPAAGTATSPLRASLLDSGIGALRFDNVGSATPTEAWKDGVVRLVGSSPGSPTGADPSACPQASSSSGAVSGGGYFTTALHSGSETIRDASACAAARSATIGILPTEWAPAGILQVTLNRSYAWCTVTGGTPDGGTGLDATVQVANGTGGYQGAVPAATFDPSTFSIAGHSPLSNYITGWGFDAGGRTVDGSSVTANVPGVRVTTKPTRYKPVATASPTPDPTASPTPDPTASPTPDPTLVDPPQMDEYSAVAVTLGAASCSSETSS